MDWTSSDSGKLGLAREYQPGTVLPENLSLEALSQFVNAGQYDASSIGPLATEVFDRLASLLPEGLGTSDSNETFGIPDFVDRLADGFQQGLGLSADEAQQLAQQVADGVQGAIDENKESAESSSGGADSSGTAIPSEGVDASPSITGDSGKTVDPQPEHPLQQRFVDSLMAKGYSQEEALREWVNLLACGNQERIAIVTSSLRDLSLAEAYRFADFKDRLRSDSEWMALAMGIGSALQAVRGAVQYALARVAAAEAAGETGAANMWKRVVDYLRGSGSAGRGEAGTAAGEEAGAAANRLGSAREKYVADQIGGRNIGGTPEAQIKTGTGSTDIDVIGPNGELIQVGGPGKAIDLSSFGKNMKVLQEYANQTGKTAQFYYQEGTPESVLKIARKWLGGNNVKPFNLP
jgi:hypothetical protein